MPVKNIATRIRAIMGGRLAVLGKEAKSLTDKSRRAASAEPIADNEMRAALAPF